MAEGDYRLPQLFSNHLFILINKHACQNEKKNKVLRSGAWEVGPSEGSSALLTWLVWGHILHCESTGFPEKHNGDGTSHPATHTECLIP